jgi:hypothetical protein
MGAFHPGLADFLRRQYTGKVLAFQAWLGPVGPDIMDAKGLLEGHGQSQGRAQDLSSPFALPAVNGDHFFIHLLSVVTVFFAHTPPALLQAGGEFAGARPKYRKAAIVPISPARTYCLKTLNN